MNIDPYSYASIVGKIFRRKGNHKMLVTVEQMTDVVSSGKKHIEIIYVRYHTGDDNFSCWWEINAFRDEWEEIK